MIITIHQPAYLPWLGYFDKIIRSDLYIFLDSVQFEKNSYTNRNKIKTPQGPIWLTVPVKSKGHMSSCLYELEIDHTQHWKDKHLKSIYSNYRRAPYFEETYSKLELLYASEHKFLADLCYEHLQFWLGELGISRTLVRSKDLKVGSSNSDLILDLCKQFKASTYISGALGKGYLKEHEFAEFNIEIQYQNYYHPVYPQLWSEFEPYMSILDFWMNSRETHIVTGGE
jgi:hypothetical protein